MLRRIKVRGYKSLVDVEVGLEPLCVIFGPNAAGKSNFLDALQLLSRIAGSRTTLKEAFQPPYRGTPLESFTFEDRGIPGLLERDSASFQIEVDVELSPSLVQSVNRRILEMKRTGGGDGSDGDADPAGGRNGKPPDFVKERFLRYRLEVEILPRTGILRVADEYLAALNAKGQLNGKRRPFLERVRNRLHLRRERQAHPTYHERYLDHSILSTPLYAPHYPHMAAMQQELASWFFFYFEPRERMRAPNPVKEVRHIGLMGEELAAFLNTLRALDEPQFRAIEKSLHMIVPSITGIDVGVNNLGEVELRILEGQTPVPAGVLSEGTLRILGLLALSGAKDPPALVGFEEPENGLHPRRIRHIAEFLQTQATSGNEQVIATTHSPLLPDLIPDEYLYICRKREGSTEIRPFSTWGALGRKPDIDAAIDDEEELSVSQRILRGDFDA